MKTAPKIATIGLSAVLMLGVAMPAANASFMPSVPSSAKAPMTSTTPIQINLSQIAREAEAAGATDIAELARSLESQKQNEAKLRAAGLSVAKPAGITGAVKKIVLWTIDHSAHLFPANVQKYLHKITTVVRNAELNSENELIIAFQVAGIPYDVAKDAAWVIMNIII
ncbi:hypothetical protein [Arthrobacter sp. MYb213]|uniref:hypothetical protein n=1 Tax=Arthrobacter sp. MYb213 TaxID=1848595 RepID=UPI000CFE0CD3|nr:hypothetical protein [Arthrobacter sp. MYb213]PRB69370.1 hypothetical protein CQ011_11365 [Arthrobacter sp. MYb213]